MKKGQDQLKKELSAIELEWNKYLNSVKTLERITEDNLLEIRSTQAKIGEILARFNYSMKIHSFQFAKSRSKDQFDSLATKIRSSIQVVIDDLEGRAIMIISDPERCIDEKLKVLYDRTISPEGLTISGLQYLKNSINEFALMLFDGRGWSRNKNAAQLLQKLDDSLTYTIIKKEKAAGPEIDLTANSGSNWFIKEKAISALLSDFGGFVTNKDDFEKVLRGKEKASLVWFNKAMAPEFCAALFYLQKASLVTGKTPSEIAEWIIEHFLFKRGQDYISPAVQTLTRRFSESRISKKSSALKQVLSVCNEGSKSIM